MACSVKIKSVVAIATNASRGASIQRIRVTGDATNCDTVYLTSACFADPGNPRKPAPVKGGRFDIDIPALAVAAGSICRCGQEIGVSAVAQDPADPEGGCQDQWIGTLDCVVCPAITGLNAAPASGAAPLIVAFQASVANPGAIVPDAAGMLYHWDFGDGATDHTHAPTTSHTYHSPGTFTATLAVNVAPGCRGATRSVPVSVTGVAASKPVLLLPFRLETRFVDVAAQSELWIRVYPAPISIDAHPRDLTATQISAGQAFWTATWNAMQHAGADREGPWRSLAARYGPRRAAWIARVTRPARVDAAVPLEFPAVTPSSTPFIPRATALPDQWVVYLWDKGAAAPQVATFPNPIAQDLKVAPDPATAGTPDPADVALDPASRWLVDFDDAVAKGMAASIPVSATQRHDGFARMVVLGMKTSGDGTAALQDLLDAHHYSDGLACVPQGTASKNTTDASAGFTRSEANGNSYATEQGARLTDPPDPNDPTIETDGAIAQRLIGLDPARGVFDHIEYANGLDQQDARDMAVALWPATLGYFVRQMLGLNSAAELAGIELARRYFIDHVRARGPIAAIRVGDTPYGILPVTTLRPLSGARTRQPAWLFNYVFRALPMWRNAAEQNTPRVGRTNDPDADLVGILGMDASSTSYQARSALGPWFLWNLLDWFDADASLKSVWLRTSQQMIRRLWMALGLSNVLPNAPILGVTFEPDSWPLEGPIVQSGTVSETDPLPAASNYITWLLQAPTVDDLRYQRFPSTPDALLYRMLRQALLLEYVHSAQDVLVQKGLITPDEIADPEFVGFSLATSTPWDLLARTVPGIGTPGQSIGSYIKDLEQSPALLAQQFPRLAALRASFARLASRPTAKLARLLSETLDLCSHRLDAWATSTASASLATARNQQVEGVHLGGFGWVENLVPAPPAPATLQLRTAERSVLDDFDKTRKARVPAAAALSPVQPAAEDNGGFIHAPSAPQGVTAAILRSGYLTHRRSTNGAALAIDLSSERVRTALWYLDGVRQGQSLSALLGYRIEERLVADHALQPFIQPLRDRYPLVANQVTPAPTVPTPTDALAAPNVADGLALQRDWAAKKLKWGDPLPAEGDPAQQSIISILEDVTDVSDAISDLSFSESVYQIIRGNPVRAGGILAAVSRGERPPEVQVVRTPHGGSTFTHRVALFCPGNPPTVLSWNSGNTNPRARAEPWLDAWLRTLLPDPANVKCWIEYDPGPPTTTPLPRVAMTLDVVDFGPLDLLAMSASPDAAQLSELEQRIVYEAYRSNLLPPGAENPAVRFEGTLNRATELSVPDLLLIARALRDVLAGARPLAAPDLSSPGSPAAASAVPDAAEVRARATASVTLALNAVGAIDMAVQNLASAIASPGSADTEARAQALRDALLDASWFGVRGSIPRGAALDGRGVSGVSISTNTATKTYTIDFTTSPAGALSAQGKDSITLLAPPGTSFSTDPADYQINGQTLQADPRVMTNAVTLTIPTDIAASTAVAVVARQMTSPPGGDHTFSVFTATDTLASVSDRYSIAGGGTSVTPQAVLVSVPNPGVAARYEVYFDVSAGGALAAGVHTITLFAPPGTLFSAAPTDYNIDGLVLATPTPGNPSPITLDGSTVTITVPKNIPAGASVKLIASRVTNPGASSATLAQVITNPGLGTYTLGIATSGDPRRACDGAGFALGPLAALITQAMAVNRELAPRAVLPTAVTVQSVTIAGSQYTIAFTTSPAGALPGAGGVISILAPAGTKFSGQAADYQVNGIQLKLPPRVSDAGVEITIPADIAESTAGSVTAHNVVHPPAGQYTMSVRTSADILAATSPSYTITGPGSSVTAATASLGLDGTTHTVTFRTSATGALSQQAADSITIHGASGVAFSSKAADYTIDGQVLTSAPKVDGGTVTIAVPADIAAATLVTVVAHNVSRQQAGGYTLGVATSQDTAFTPSSLYTSPLSAIEWIEPLQKLFGKGFMVLPRFTPPNGPELDGAFSDSTQLLGGAGTARTTGARWWQQLTHVRPPISRVDLASSLARTLAGATSPGIVLAQLPRLPNDRWLALPFRSSVSGVLVSMDAATAGAANVDYDVSFATSEGGALPPGADRITLTAPPGTDLPTNGYKVSVSNGHAASITTVTAASWPPPAGGGPGSANNQATLSLGSSTIAGGDRVTITIAGVTNPAQPGDHALIVTTSADPEPVPSASYTISAGAGAPTIAPGLPPATGRVSLVALTAGQFDPTQSSLANPLAGLLLDEWPEQIPNRVESTAVVFHHEEPSARAPQALLLAVSPRPEGTWTENNFELLREILEETLDLVKVRTVDVAGFADGGQILPALYLATNTDDDTVTATWAGSAFVERVQAASAEFASPMRISAADTRGAAARTVASRGVGG